MTGVSDSQEAFGYQEDAESGLKLLGHRYYDAGSGRFITRDPIGSGTNWYRYADNNPLKQVDPTGLEITEIHEYDRKHGTHHSEDVQKMITWLWDAGRQDDARELQRMLREGRVNVQTGQDQYKTALFGLKNLYKTDAITRGDRMALSIDTLSSESFFYVLSTLVHELQHVHQNASDPYHVGQVVYYLANEHDAILAERRLLRELLTKRWLTPAQRAMIEDVLGTVNENLGG